LAHIKALEAQYEQDPTSWKAQTESRSVGLESLQGLNEAQGLKLSHCKAEMRRVEAQPSASDTASEVLTQRKEHLAQKVHHLPELTA